MGRVEEYVFSLRLECQLHALYYYLLVCGRRVGSYRPISEQEDGDWGSLAHISRLRS